VVGEQNSAVGSLRLPEYHCRRGGEGTGILTADPILSIAIPRYCLGHVYVKELFQIFIKSLFFGNNGV
jgi:hypothetical protein